MRILKCILFFLFANIYFVFAQSTWEYYEKNGDIKEIIHYSLEYDSGKLITVSTEIHKSNDHTQENLFKSNIRIHNSETGEVMLVKHYSIDSLSASLGWVFYNDETKNFIITGEAHNTTLANRRGYFLVTKWDENLNFISDTMVRLEPLNEYNVLWKLLGNTNKEKEWIILGVYNDKKEYFTLNTKLLLVRLDKSGNINKLKWFDKKSITSIHTSIFFDEIKNQYILFGQNTYFLSPDFEIIDSLTTIDAIEHYGGFAGKSMKFTSSKYLVSARFGDYDRGLAFFDKNIKFLKGIKTKNQDNTFDFAFASQNFDFIDTLEVYFGVQSGFYNYYAVGKVNSNLDPYWIKYFSLNDSFRHYIWSITATLDGGCVIVGAKGEDFANNVPNDLAAWAIKLDGQGNTVATKEPGNDTWEITVFPNPSSGDFRIEIVDNADANKLLLYDLQGREIKKYQNLTVGSNTFQFDNIPAGTYIWKLVNDGKEIGEGKWVKAGL